MNVARPPIWVVMKAHLAADPRKTGMLAFLFVVMIVLYARWLLAGQAPQDAAAALATGVPVAQGPAGQTATAALPPVPARIRPERPLICELSRDPFAIRLERFAVDPDAPTSGAPTTTAPVTAPPAWRAQDFVLQSTICGPMPMAWINGRPVQPGEEIDGLVLERVEPTRVVLRRDDEERVLVMD